jgi:hypothetical protein
MQVFQVKKTVLSILLLTFVMSVVGCSEQSKELRKVEVKECGTFEVSMEWNSYENNGYIYIVNSELKPIMIRSFSFSGIDDNQQGKSELNDFFAVQNLTTISSQVLSNGAVFGKAILLKNGIQVERLFLEIGCERRALFIVWDESIDLVSLEEIASSFIRK